MKTYCVRERKKTECVPGTEEVVLMKNRREAMRCICASCGARKFSIIPTRMDALNWDDFVSDRRSLTIDPSYDDWKKHSGQYYAVTGERLFGKKVNPKKMKKQLEALTKKKPQSRKPKKSVMSTKELFKIMDRAADEERLRKTKRIIAKVLDRQADKKDLRRRVRRTTGPGRWY